MTTLCDRRAQDQTDEHPGDCHQARCSPAHMYLRDPGNRRQNNRPTRRPVSGSFYLVQSWERMSFVNREQYHDVQGESLNADVTSAAVLPHHASFPSRIRGRRVRIVQAAKAIDCGPRRFQRTGWRSSRRTYAFTLAFRSPTDSNSTASSRSCSPRKTSKVAADWC